MSSAIPEAAANPSGLHQRYRVTKANGEPVDPMATYFVLRLDGHGRDWHHIRACRRAAEEYAKCILQNPEAEHLHRMAEQLETLVENFDSMGG